MAMAARGEKSIVGARECLTTRAAGVDGAAAAALCLEWRLSALARVAAASERTARDRDTDSNKYRKRARNLDPKRERGRARAGRRFGASLPASEPVGVQHVVSDSMPEEASARNHPDDPPSDDTWRMPGDPRSSWPRFRLLRRLYKLIPGARRGEASSFRFWPKPPAQTSDPSARVNLAVISMAPAEQKRNEWKQPAKRPSIPEAARQVARLRPLPIVKEKSAGIEPTRHDRAARVRPQHRGNACQSDPLPGGTPPCAAKTTLP